MTLREAISEASSAIDRRDAETLLQYVLTQDRAYLRAHADDLLAPAHLAAFRDWTGRRALREPLQYITGQQEFYGLTLRVAPAVLIPRPETELLVEAVLLWTTTLHRTSPTEAEAERILRIADVGTGSGAIAVALATHLAGARFLATDISPTALAVARLNASSHGCESRIDFREADLLPPITGHDDWSHLPFDVIASNPPYIPGPDAATMQPEVVHHEPHTALFAGDDGLSVYRRLIPEASARLRPGGLLAMEFGFGQRDQLATLLQAWSNVRFVDDLQRIPRIALAEKPAHTPHKA